MPPWACPTPAVQIMAHQNIGPSPGTVSSWLLVAWAPCSAGTVCHSAAAALKLPLRLQDPVQHSAAFINLLLDRIQDPSTAPISRTASAAYLASFLARATFVPRSVLLASQWTHRLQQES